MTIIGKIRAEIERRINTVPEDWIGAPAAIETLRDILYYLDILEADATVGEEYAIQVGKELHTFKVGSHDQIDKMIREENRP